jgi:threonine dehydrogenase-like Zn-dependent dehydrogenase
MRAAVTSGVGEMALLERPEPPRPGPGEVVVHPEAVGICGSDYHFYTGELSPTAGGALPSPRWPSRCRSVSAR